MNSNISALSASLPRTVSCKVVCSKGSIGVVFMWAAASPASDCQVTRTLRTLMNDLSRFWTSAPL